MRTPVLSMLTAVALTVIVPIQAAPPSDASAKDIACGQLKKTVAAHDGLPESGPVGMGWFCEFVPIGDGRDKDWYVIALRSNRKCDGVCSNLMGWYSVDRRNGEVHEFDVNENAVGAKIRAATDLPNTPDQ